MAACESQWSLFPCEVDSDELCNFWAFDLHRHIVFSSTFEAEALVGLMIYSIASRPVSSSQRMSLFSCARNAVVCTRAVADSASQAQLVKVLQLHLHRRWLPVSHKELSFFVWLFDFCEFIGTCRFPPAEVLVCMTVHMTDELSNFINISRSMIGEFNFSLCEESACLQLKPSLTQAVADLAG